MGMLDLSTAQWRKSSHSAHEGGECVEVADLRAAVGVRDSKAPEAGHLSLSAAGFQTSSPE
ncbi:DUF397 domain-containing protein [Actinomadura rudentiformis]|uniref:DUF397 domain-containing protein n=2 Tax=Actinomadura rudentiformis TaxID=359158 RepID=A0A6H9Z6T9_9ACTN|nr:DUF397 domain-containing protein [Actinomadura rudentiformis]